MLTDWVSDCIYVVYKHAGWVKNRGVYDPERYCRALALSETVTVRVFRTCCGTLPRGISALGIVLLVFLRFCLPEAYETRAEDTEERECIGGTEERECISESAPNICDHNCMLSQCNQCIGVGICEHNWKRNGCK